MSFTVNYPRETSSRFAQTHRVHLGDPFIHSVSLHMKRNDAFTSNAKMQSPASTANYRSPGREVVCMRENEGVTQDRREFKGITAPNPLLYQLMHLVNLLHGTLPTSFSRCGLFSLGLLNSLDFLVNI